uniref:Major sperm protein n=1 Tax=Onchocerca volvulus TaxID=6282 RepID=A0A8R1Y1I3_ONCVO
MSVIADEEYYEVLQILRNRLHKFVDEAKVARNDLNRIFTEDWWPLSFLLAYRYDVDVTYAVIVECLKWRRSFAVNNISLLELKPLLDRGLAYIHGKDCDGSSILWINMRQHIIGQKNSDKLIIYWLERHTMELQAASITLLFDMSSCCLQNMDLDFIKFIIHSCKYYYPSCLTSLLIFENPGLLKASWILLRTWMPPEMQRLLQHVKRSSLSAYVPLPYIPIRYGGQDNFIFTMDELARCIPSQLPSSESFHHNQQYTFQNDIADSDLSSNDTAYFNNLNLKRSVTFEEDDTIRDTTLTCASQILPSITKRNGIPQALRPLAEARLHSPTKDYAKVKFLSICPREELKLNQINGENDMADVMVLKNESVKNAAYKIKITSPEKFRVRPSTGIIGPGSIEFIRIYLQNEFRNSVPREKLLLMAVETSEESSENFGNIWKNSNEEARIEHKLKCRLSIGNDIVTSTVELMDPVTEGRGNNLPVSAIYQIHMTLFSGNIYKNVGNTNGLQTKVHHDLDSVHHRASIVILHLAASILYINFKYTKRFLFQIYIFFKQSFL